MQNDASSRADKTIPNGHIKHSRVRVPMDVTLHINRVIARFVPSNKHREIEKLFENRVPYNHIKQWRYGRRHTPQWARDIIDARVERIMSTINQIIPAKSRGELGAMNLRKWHARNKDQKKKPAD